MLRQSTCYLGSGRKVSTETAQRWTNSVLIPRNRPKEFLDLVTHPEDVAAL